MRRPALALFLPLLALSACRAAAPDPVALRCDGAAARAVSQTGTLNVVWGAGTHFYVRVGDRTLALLIDRPELVSSDVLQGLSTRTVRVEGRESSSAAKICADAVAVVEASTQ